MCARESTYEEAVSICEELGSRLCTVAELGRGEANPEACGYDSVFSWAWAAPGDGVAECGNMSSLGVAGRPGEWFAFISANANTYHEVRVLADPPRSDGTILISADVFYGSGERAPTVGPPQLSQRPGGTVLRFNLTENSRRRYFVRASATVPHSVVVAAPPEYAVKQTESSVGSGGELLPLQLHFGSAGGVAEIEIPFGFDFYGVQYTRLWVSRDGYLTFEAPRPTDPFAGVETRSAVVACAGTFDGLGEETIKAAMGSKELVVTWTGHLYDSSLSSNISVSLQPGGKVTVAWTEIHLDNGGSLQGELLFWLSLTAPLNLSMVGVPNAASGLHEGAVESPDNEDAESLGASSIDYSRYFGPANSLSSELSNISVMCNSQGDTICFAQYNNVDHSETDSTGKFVAVVSTGYNRTFLEATSYCKSRNLELARLEDDRDITLVRHLCKYANAPTCFVGLIESGDGWRWSDGTAYNISLYAEPPMPLHPGQTVWAGLQATDQLRSQWDIRSIEHPVQAFVCADSIAHNGINLHGDVKIKLPPMVLGGSIAVSTWMKMDQYAGVQLFGSYQSSECDDSSLGCRNAVGDDLDRHGWLAIGIDGGGHGDAGNRQESITLGETHLHGRATSNELACPRQFEQITTVAECIEVSQGFGESYEAGLTNSVGAPGSICMRSFDSRGQILAGEPRMYIAPLTASGDSFSQALCKLNRDLVVAGAQLDTKLTKDFFRHVWMRWALVTAVFVERNVQIYVDGELHGSGDMEEIVPRMLRQENTIGGSLDGVPLPLRSSVHLADFRIYDRSISTLEVAALYAEPFGDCCVSSQLVDAFGMSTIDLTTQAMTAMTDRSVTSGVVVQPAQTTNVTGTGPTLNPCSVAETAAAVRDVDICGEITTIEDCNGFISDGVGTYPKSADCGLRIQGYRGAQYTLRFEEFETEAGNDVLEIYDGSSSDAPLLGRYSGSVFHPVQLHQCPLTAPFAHSECPPACSDCRERFLRAEYHNHHGSYENITHGTCDNSIGNLEEDSCLTTCAHSCSSDQNEAVSTGPPADLLITSTGPSLYLHFSSNDHDQSAGFRVKFACTGEPIEYWKPADVAVHMDIGQTVSQLGPSTLHAECLTKTLLSVQCCADAETECANARVTGLSLSGQLLRGSLPEALGSLNSLHSLKLCVFRHADS